MQHDQRPPHQTGRTFSFSFSFGKKPQSGGPVLDELRVRPPAEAGQPPDGAGIATHTLGLDGKRAPGVTPPGYEDPAGAPADPAKQRESEMWELLHQIAEGKGAYPDTQRWHRRLSIATTIIAVAMPLAILVLTLATGQTQETVFFATFGALVVAVMFRGSIR